MNTISKVTDVAEYKQQSAALAAQEKQELSVIEQVAVQGDLSKLSPEQRVMYYKKVCDSLGLNPYTKPFDYIMLNGKLTLYAKKDATEQLRKLNGISIEKLETQVIDDLYVVKAYGRTRDGRTDVATGAVTLGTLKGDAKCNAIMKCETKAKRRVTLSISGMGWTDESEIETIPGAQKVDIDMQTGFVVQPTITAAEASELDCILEECGPECREMFMQLLLKHGVKTLQAITQEMYPRAKGAAVERLNALRNMRYQKKLEEQNANADSAESN